MAEIGRRKFLRLAVASGLLLPVGGCAGITDQMTLDEIVALLREYLAKGGGDIDEEAFGNVRLGVTYPAGRSPKVFTSGWVFGARASADGKDVSDTIKWSGTGSFSPQVGSSSRPVFASEGANTIEVSVTVGDRTYKKAVSVNAVSPAGYAWQGATAQAPADAHGCPACPHPVIGPIVTGSPNVLVNGKPAARVGDRGVHAACCGPNEFEIINGDDKLLINGKPAAMVTWSETRHCGGKGTIIG